MFSRKKKAAAPPPPKAGKSPLSFIGPEVVVNGDLTSDSQVHVDGRIEGHVRCAQLCQGGSGVIAGDICADEARIAGLVQGTVSAGTVIVESSGRITGDVSYDTISIAAGAQIDGRLARREALSQGSAPLRVTAAAEAKPAEAAKPAETARPAEAVTPAGLFPGAERRAAIG